VRTVEAIWRDYRVAAGGAGWPFWGDPPAKDARFLDDDFLREWDQLIRKGLEVAPMLINFPEQCVLLKLKVVQLLLAIGCTDVQVLMFGC
jgi:hypothetical protein